MNKLRKWLMYLVVGFFVLGILGSLLPQDEQITVKKEVLEPSSQKLEPIVYNENHGALVKSFSYALQASVLCKNLSMRVDTPNKVKEKIGIETDIAQSIYNKDYHFGINSALADEKGALCKEAWLHFGCNGNIEANLLQENPFNIENPELCKY